jgi:chemotaxis methyl-accepting protein methylase
VDLQSLEWIKEQLEGWAGIALERGRRLELLESLVSDRVQALGLSSAREYCDRLRGPSDPEAERLINAVTVTYTWFFRDLGQMQALGELLEAHWPKGKSVQIWVAACATGEEAYSVAMLAHRAGRPVELLATDINSDALAHGRRGWYGKWAVREVPEGLSGLLVQRGNRYQVAEALRATVRFERHNLMQPPPMPPLGGAWDVIICRNVLIYFPPQTARPTLSRLGAAIDPRGFLLLGGSEVVSEAPAGLELVDLGGGTALKRGARPQPPRPAAPAPAPRAAPKPPPAPIAPPRPVPALARPAPLEGAARREGAAHLKAGRLAEAIGALEKALEADPLDARAQMVLGVALHRLGDPQAALQALRGALVLEPSLWPAAFYLALSYADLGWTEEARKTYLWVQALLQASPASSADDEVLQDFEPWRHDVLALSRLRGKAP